MGENEDYISELCSLLDDYPALGEKIHEFDAEIDTRYATAKLATEEELEEWGSWQHAVWLRLSEEQRENMDLESFSGLDILLHPYMEYAMTADILFTDQPESRNTNYRARGRSYFGIDFTGQGDIAERIMYGMDRHTLQYGKMEVEKHTMQAVIRLADIISAKQKEGPPRITGSEGADGLVPGPWRGYFIERDDSIEDSDLNVSEEKHFIINFVGNDDMEGFGSCIEPESGAIFATLKHEETNGTTLNFSVKDEDNLLNDKYNFEVVAELEKWGFSGRAYISNEIEVYIALWPDDSSVTDDTDRIIGESIREIQMEMKDFRFPGDVWNIQFHNLAIETAVELAHYLMVSTIKKQHFNSEIPTVGGKIRTVTITPDGEYREHWFNPESPSDSPLTHL